MTCVLWPDRAGRVALALCGREAPASSLTYDHWALAQQGHAAIRGHVQALHLIPGNELCPDCVSAANRNELEQWPMPRKDGRHV